MSDKTDYGPTVANWLDAVSYCSAEQHLTNTSCNILCILKLIVMRTSAGRPKVFSNDLESKHCGGKQIPFLLSPLLPSLPFLFG